MSTFLMMKFHEIAVMDESAIGKPAILAWKAFRAVNVSERPSRVFDRARLHDLHLDFLLGNSL